MLATAYTLGVLVAHWGFGEEVPAHRWLGVAVILALSGAPDRNPPR